MLACLHGWSPAGSPIMLAIALLQCCLPRSKWWLYLAGAGSQYHEPNEMFWSLIGALGVTTQVLLYCSVAFAAVAVSSYWAAWLQSMPCHALWLQYSGLLCSTSLMGRWLLIGRWLLMHTLQQLWRHGRSLRLSG